MDWESAVSLAFSYDLLGPIGLVSETVFASTVLFSSLASLESTAGLISAVLLSVESPPPVPGKGEGRAIPKSGLLVDFVSSLLISSLFVSLLELPGSTAGRGGSDFNESPCFVESPNGCPGKLGNSLSDGEAGKDGSGIGGVLTGNPGSGDDGAKGEGELGAAAGALLNPGEGAL